MMHTVNFDLVLGNIGWKDTNLRHLGCNQNFANSLNLKTPNDIIGMRDADLPNQTRQDCIFHEENDRLALMGHEVNKLHYFCDSLFLIVKKPLYDNMNEITGIVYHCQELKHPHLKDKLCSPLYKKFAQHKHNANPFSLSKRELECLRYILQGNTSNTIANSLGLTKRTIDFYIGNIKNKMGCANKSELIISAMKHGYDKC